VFLIASRSGRIQLPGMILRVRHGPGPQPDDFKLRANLYCMSTARALLENMRPSRARSGAASTPKRNEIRAYLEHFLRNSGRERLRALRDQIKSLGPQLEMQEEAKDLDAIIGTLLGKHDLKLPARVPIAPSARAVVR
jgi:hypothetical protein